MHDKSPTRANTRGGHNKVLLLGAGMVAGPAIAYLTRNNVALTVAANNPDHAQRLLDRAGAQTTAVNWSGNDRTALKQLVQEHAVVISLLPAPMHPDVARLCVGLGRHLVTTSYVSAEMRALDPQARAANVSLINEVGVDPGIDHMSAMRLIDGLRQRGGSIRSFRSYCGGIPSPGANNNPWGYKFSWSPEGVLRASKQGACFLQNGHKQERSATQVLAETHALEIDGVGELEAYANRDATHYISLYGLEEIETMYRGTLRYPGWTETIAALHQLELISDEPPAAADWKTLMAARLHGTGDDLRTRLAQTLGCESHAAPIERLCWLGLLEPVALENPQSLAGSLAALMAKRMAYAPGEHDLLAMHHLITARFPEGDEIWTSSLVVVGDKQDTAMAKTVGLPVAIAAKLRLDGAINTPGVSIPTTQHLYEPIIAELANHGIQMTETCEMSFS